MKKGYKQNRISEAVWPWVESQREAGTEKPSTWKQASVQFLVMLCIVAILYFWAKIRTMAAVVLGIGTCLLLLGLFWPTGFLRVNHLFVVFGRFVGRALTWLLLLPFYYVVFLPARLMLLLKRKDPMNRVLDENAESYWVIRKAPAGADRHRKQY